ncbi:MAG: DUF1501 domain-containing protein [Chloroflexi bacterium]|nr:MAG: DUF1501 domain-containing protein [Chloroflexota bacterium]MBL1193628.1 DUF1501 domain-containing protein [Chloroflexota bacterium]NOH10920.1 DUF1501 domain-containing protein [Chloroflexota bacterium]
MIRNNFTRRDFLKSAAVAPFAVAWPAWMPRLAFAPAQSDPRGDVMVVVFLRGAADVLNMVIPHGEEAYYQSRPTLGVARPDDTRANAQNRVIDLDGFFGLHPAMGPLMDAWSSQNLAIVHACGAPDESRSHFKAMELMERGVSDEQGPASGWIGRHLSTYNTGNPSPLRAVGLGEMVPRSMYGSVPVTALRSIIDFHLGGDDQAVAQMTAGLQALYSGPDDLSVVGQETLDILDTLAMLDPEGYTSAGEMAYPQSEFGYGLQQIAQLVKAQVGLEVATIDVGGWDTHFAQGTAEGLMPNLMGDLGQGLAAFHADLHEHHKNLTVVVMSEFGRRVAENASLGTDHGHGSMMMLMGGNVQGGVVHGQWPGLERGQLFGPGDLAVTTDYRDVLAEVLSKRLNNQAFGEIFPDYQTTMRGFVKG